MSLLKNIFKRNKKEPEPSLKDNPSELQEICERILIKEGISKNGDNFFTDGYACSNIEEAKRHIQNMIQTKFEDVSLQLDEAVLALKRDVIELDSKIADCEAKLDPTIVNGELYEIDQKIKDGETMEKELEAGALSERNTQKAQRENHQQFEESMGALAKNGFKDVETMVEFMKHTHIFDLRETHYKRQMRIEELLQVKIQSTFTRPKRAIFMGAFIACIVFLTGEVGFSIKVIDMIMDGFGQTGNKLMSLLFCMCITGGLAIIFRILIEQLLFKTAKQRNFFFRIVFMIFCFLTLVYSYTEGRPILQPEITNKAVILSFFSTLMALANALTFREASYLQQLYNTLYKHGIDPGTLYKKRSKFVKEWMDKLQEYKKIRHKKAAEHDVIDAIVEKIKSRLLNLRIMSINQFWSGFDKKSRESQINLPEVYQNAKAVNGIQKTILLILTLFMLGSYSCKEVVGKDINYVFLYDVLKEEDIKHFEDLLKRPVNGQGASLQQYQPGEYSNITFTLYLSSNFNLDPIAEITLSKKESVKAKREKKIQDFIAGLKEQMAKNKNVKDRCMLRNLESMIKEMKDTGMTYAVIIHSEMIENSGPAIRQSVNRQSGFRFIDDRTNGFFCNSDFDTARKRLSEPDSWITKHLVKNNIPKEVLQKMSFTLCPKTPPRIDSKENLECNFVSDFWKPLFEQMGLHPREMRMDKYAYLEE